MNLADCRVAASNLYNASRELAMTAKQHELMGTSHDTLQQLVLDAEKLRTDLQNRDEQIATLRNVTRELEKMRGQAVPAVPPAALVLVDELIRQIEKCGASEELTRASLMAVELQTKLKEAKP